MTREISTCDCGSASWVTKPVRPIWLHVVLALGTYGTWLLVWFWLANRNYCAVCRKPENSVLQTIKLLQSPRTEQAQYISLQDSRPSYIQKKIKNASPEEIEFFEKLRDRYDRRLESKGVERVFLEDADLLVNSVRDVLSVFFMKYFAKNIKQFHIKHKQLVFRDDYGDLRTGKFEQEIATYFEEKVLPDVYSEQQRILGSSQTHALAKFCHIRKLTPNDFDILKQDVTFLSTAISDSLKSDQVYWPDSLSLYTRDIDSDSKLNIYSPHYCSIENVGKIALFNNRDLYFNESASNEFVLNFLQDARDLFLSSVYEQIDNFRSIGYEEYYSSIIDVVREKLEKCDPKLGLILCDVLAIAESHLTDKLKDSVGAELFDDDGELPTSETPSTMALGLKYEEECADLLRDGGLDAQVTPGSGDQGADIIIRTL